MTPSREAATIDFIQQQRERWRSTNQREAFTAEGEERKKVYFDGKIQPRGGEDRGQVSGYRKKEGQGKGFNSVFLTGGFNCTLTK